MKIIRSISVLSITLIVVVLSVAIFFRNGIISDSLGVHFDNPFSKTVQVPQSHSSVDENYNGLPDPIDIVNAARKEVEQRTNYKSAYYSGGYPPDDEGVCTDVIWRGLMGADISLKELMDEDIAEHTDLYPRVNNAPDPNIDFRRVPNQFVFFERFTESLTTELIPGNTENLKQW